MPLISWKVIAKVIMFFWLLMPILYGGFFVSLYPMHEEGSLLHYLAWMIDEQGAVPYKDVFETAFPGSFLFHIGIGHFLGYDDAGFRIADAGWLMALMYVTWLIMRRLDNTIAWITVLGFGCLYFKAGAAMTLQRDYVGILPVAMALLIALQVQWTVAARSFLIGIFFGIAASMKPHLVIGAPAIMVLLMQQDTNIKKLINITAKVAVGFLVSFSMPLLWLAHLGAMPAFLDMLLNYMPLYIDLDGFVETHQEWKIQWQGYAMILLSFTADWMPLLGLALWQGRLVTLSSSIQRQMLVTLSLLVLAYMIYPFPANKFYNYHWMPFRYFGLLLAGFILLPVFQFPGLSLKRKALCGIAYLLLMSRIAYPQPVEMVKNMYAMATSVNEKKQVMGDVVGQYLIQHANPGDLVQPLDTGGAALRGMLQGKVVMATPYSTFQDLFHHYDSPVIQKMRELFIQTLISNPPRFIIDTYTTPEMLCPDGNVCQHSELDALISEKYTISLEQCKPEQRCHMRIYELQ